MPSCRGGCCNCAESGNFVKDQPETEGNQDRDADHGYLFTKKGLSDEISIFDGTPRECKPCTGYTKCRSSQDEV